MKKNGSHKSLTAFFSRRGTAAILAFVLLAALPLVASSCAGNPPALDDVRQTYTDLIEASVRVNDIFFGKGLPTYDRDEASGDGSAEYDEASGTYYWIIEDADVGTVVKYYAAATKEYKYLLRLDEAAYGEHIAAGGATGEKYGAGNYYFVPIEYKEVLKEYVYDETSPVYYDYVRLDSDIQSVASIKELAEAVYSRDYLDAVYVIMFDGYADDNGSMIYARYMIDESGETDFFLKSNRFEPYFETQTTYDYSTMKIIQPSRPHDVRVELTAYGRYVDRDTLTVVTGEHSVTLNFVFENGVWRLDTPTY